MRVAEMFALVVKDAGAVVFAAGIVTAFIAWVCCAVGGRSGK